jgi:hypothetical protein|tara:strand:+ start:4625 stop:5275 length:651 start_codon:yes stop_codon:yes gene_type:complete
MLFDAISLGQSIIKYQVPLEVFVGLNELYETQKKHLPNANKQLSGKIPDEVSMFYSGANSEKMRQHSYISEDVLNWFYSIFDHYLKWNKTMEYHMDINSIWVNEMKAGDYNPVHIHQGKLFTGLSSVMILKLPKDMGPEIVRPDQPMNGQLQILGSATGQFVTADYSPKMKIGDFYVFPYDIRHVVYPFTNKKEKRRTLVCNCDVSYNPVTSRTTR